MRENLVEAIFDDSDNSCLNGRERELDDRIVEIQRIFNEGTKEEKDEAFEELYNDFKYFIRNQVSNLYLVDGDVDDLIQEATIQFHKAIKKFDKEKGAFVPFARMFIYRNVRSLFKKAKRNKENNISVVSLDAYSGDSGRNNYDDYLYYNVSDSEDIQEKFIKSEQYREIMNQTKEILTERERTVLYLYVKDNSYSSIAETLGIDGKSVDNALHRAKVKMRDLKKNVI